MAVNRPTEDLQGKEPIGLKLPFTKYNGCGNDFILIDNRSDHFPQKQRSPLIHSLCCRRKGIGADGLILLEHSPNSISMRYFNADGLEASMCGNGIRCLHDFTDSIDGYQESRLIETLRGPLKTQHKNNEIAVRLGPPNFLHKKKRIEVLGQNYSIDVIDTGVPHAILFVETPESIPFIPLSEAIRFHPDFTPEGVNVNICKVPKKNHLSIRTYERGVENETLGCGTGAAASALSAALRFNLSSPIHVHTQSEETLLISFQNQEKFTHVVMQGGVQRVFEGVIEINRFLD